jgi:ketosteroid isomerase-like protein
MTSDPEAQIRRLADIEALKTLKHRYAAYCDDGYNADGIASLFTEDAVWDGGPFGRFEGREAIREFFTGLPEAVDWACHYMLNPVIEVDGDAATGAWLLWQPLVLKKDSQAMWISARYDDTYVRVGDEWLHKSVEVDIQAFSPYEKGFGKMRFAPPPV